MLYVCVCVCVYVYVCMCVCVCVSLCICSMCMCSMCIQMEVVQSMLDPAQPDSDDEGDLDDEGDEDHSDEDDEDDTDATGSDTDNADVQELVEDGEDRKQNGEGESTRHELENCGLSTTTWETSGTNDAFTHDGQVLEYIRIFQAVRRKTETTVYTVWDTDIRVGDSMEVKSPRHNTTTRNTRRCLGHIRVHFVPNGDKSKLVGSNSNQYFKV